MRLFHENLEALAVDTATVREMDRRTIEDFGVPGSLLMENAGAAAAEVACETARPGKVIILAGAGNNAGDGFVVARYLANRGYDVGVIIAVPPEKYTGDALLNFRIINAMGIPAARWTERQCLRQDAGLLVDALLGTGLKGDLRAPFDEIVTAVNSVDVPVLAVDIPTGLDGDTGRVHGDAVEADVTVTFALPKNGLFEGGGPRYAGRVVLADIEMPRAVYPRGREPRVE